MIEEQKGKKVGSSSESGVKLGNMEHNTRILSHQGLVGPSFVHLDILVTILIIQSFWSKHSPWQSQL